jgi:hypothetical protein
LAAFRSQSQEDLRTGVVTKADLSDAASIQARPDLDAGAIIRAGEEDLSEVLAVLKEQLKSVCGRPG